MKFPLPKLFSSWLTRSLLIAIIISSTTTAEEYSQENLTKGLKPRSSGPYCGLYLMHALLKIYGQDSNFTELIKPEYIGSYQGSSLAELKKLAKDYGLYAVPIENLTSSGLRNTPTPVIIHVKNSVATKEYTHYELFLGIKENKAQIFDPPNPIRLIPFHELAPRWDGTGLIVSNKPINLKPIFVPQRKQFIMYAVIAIVVILVVHWSKWRWSGMLDKLDRHKVFGLSIAQGAAFVVLALFSGMTYHFANDEGFLAHANATATIQQAQFSSFIPKINMEKTKSLLSSGAIIIDARYKKDFDGAHLKGAINIPVDSMESERRKKMDAINKNATIVVYCQSGLCKYADKIAIELFSDGFTDISIYRDGWMDWSSKENNSEQKK